jgi:hypothetical protein
MDSTFAALSSNRIALIISETQKKVVIATPGIHSRVADAIIATADRIGLDNVNVILDCSEKVFRLGFGDFDAVKRLKESGIIAWQHTGLRFGILICDSRAWSYNPAALYIETESEEDDEPNAIRLSSNEAEKLLVQIYRPGKAVSTDHTATALDERSTRDADKFDDASTPGSAVSIAMDQKAGDSFDESTHAIGATHVDYARLQVVEENLEVAPPVKFDVARQVQVFSPYIQYVDIQLKGASIQRHTIQLPKSIMGMAENSEIVDRLKTTFKLIEKDSEISSKQLEKELRQIRDLYAKSLGVPYGRVLLRSKRVEFDKDIEALRKKIETHQENIKANLSEELDKSKKKIVDYYLPVIMERPPKELTAQIPDKKPSKEQIINWLSNAIEKSMPDVDKIIEEMVLECIFRDVTYETLNKDDFAKALENAFPLINWSKPFEEFKAAASVPSDR